MEAVEEPEEEMLMVVPTAPPPDYSAENDRDELPPSYEECVRLGLAA